MKIFYWTTWQNYWTTWQNYWTTWQNYWTTWQNYCQSCHNISISRHLFIFLLDLNYDTRHKRCLKYANSLLIGVIWHLEIPNVAKVPLVRAMTRHVVRYAFMHSFKHIHLYIHIYIHIHIITNLDFNSYLLTYMLHFVDNSMVQSAGSYIVPELLYSCRYVVR